MKTSSWLIPLAMLALGIGIGTLWSPRPKELTPEQLAQAAKQFQSTRSTPPSTASQSASSARSQRSRQRSSTLAKDLTVENLFALVALIDDEEDINPMELARYATQVTNLNEFEAIALLNELKGPYQDGESEKEEFAQIVSLMVFSRLCEINGPEAMRMLSTGEIGGSEVEGFSTFGMNSWVAADPEGASRWMNGILTKLDKVAASGTRLDEMEESLEMTIVDSGALESYLRGMSGVDPEGVQKTIDQFQSQEVREGMQEELINQLVERAASAEEIMSLLQDDKLNSYDNNKQELVEKLSETDPESAKNYAESQKPGVARDQMFASIANKMIQKNPAEGAAWYQAQELSPETRETDRLQRITNLWMHRDLEGAATWLLQQPNNADRDYSESLLAGQSARTGEWEAAFRWNADITNPGTQETSLDRLLKQGWNRRNRTFKPEAVQAARAAGFGEAVDNYIKAHPPTRGSGSRLGGSPSR